MGLVRTNGDRRTRGARRCARAEGRDLGGGARWPLIMGVGAALLLAAALSGARCMVMRAASIPLPGIAPPPLLYEPPPPVPYASSQGRRFALATYDSGGFYGDACLNVAEASGECVLDVVINDYGKTLAAGWAIVDGSYRFVAARLIGGAQGGFDASFGGDGAVVTDFTRGSHEFAYAVAVDGNNNTVLGGGMWRTADEATTAEGERLWFALARYRAPGGLDDCVSAAQPGFSSDGKQFTDVPGSLHECITDIAIDDQNRIIAAGWGYTNGHYVIALARYTAQGELDASFGVGGTVLTNLPDDPDEGAVAVALAGGQILVAAQAGTVDGTRRIALVSYSANGSYMGTRYLGATGSGQSLRVKDMAVHGSDVVLAGTFELSSTVSRFFVAKASVLGGWDAGFGAGGIALIDFTASNQEEALAVDLFPSGNIAVGGYAVVGGNDRFAVAKLNPNGQLIQGFGFGGKLLTDIAGTKDERIHAVCAYTVQGEEGILAGGVCGSW